MSGARGKVLDSFAGQFKNAGCDFLYRVRPSSICFGATSDVSAINGMIAPASRLALAPLIAPKITADPASMVQLWPNLVGATEQGHGWMWVLKKETARTWRRIWALLDGRATPHAFIPKPTSRQYSHPARTSCRQEVTHLGFGRRPREQVSLPMIAVQGADSGQLRLRLDGLRNQAHTLFFAELDSVGQVHTVVVSGVLNE